MPEEIGMLLPVLLQTIGCIFVSPHKLLLIGEVNLEVLRHVVEDALDQSGGTTLRVSLGEFAYHLRQPPVLDFDVLFVKSGLLRCDRLTYGLRAICGPGMYTWHEFAFLKTSEC